MMHDDPAAVRRFDAVGVSVFTVDGEPDTLAFYDPAMEAGNAWLTMSDPVDVREWR